jgi:hypothetical protein
VPSSLNFRRIVGQSRRVKARSRVTLELVALREGLNLSTFTDTKVVGIQVDHPLYFSEEICL